MLRSHDGKTFAPRALVFKTGCADAYVAIAEAFERASVARARFKPEIHFECLEGDHALD
jgi:hypothetical protein